MNWDLKISRIHPGFGFFFLFEAVRDSPTLAAPSSSCTRRFFKWGTPRTRPRPLRCTSSSPPSRSQACPPLPCWAESSRWWWCPRPGPRPRAWWHRVLSFPHRAPPLHRVEAFLFHAVREDDPDHPTKKGRKTSALRNWSYFLWENFCVAAGWGHWVPPTRTASHPVSVPAESPPANETDNIWKYIIIETGPSEQQCRFCLDLRDISLSSQSGQSGQAGHVLCGLYIIKTSWHIKMRRNQPLLLSDYQKWSLLLSCPNL